MSSSSVTVTDLFCGAGGSTTGAMQAGAEVRLAVNHWSRALETHQTNYPHVEHVLTDISQADPRRYPSTAVLLASPECVNHSLSKGVRRKGQAQLGLWEQKPPDPAEERSRCTMYVIHNQFVNPPQRQRVPHPRIALLKGLPSFSLLHASGGGSEAVFAFGLAG